MWKAILLAVIAFVADTDAACSTLIDTAGGCSSWTKITQVKFGGSAVGCDYSNDETYYYNPPYIKWSGADATKDYLVIMANVDNNKWTPYWVESEVSGSDLQGGSVTETAGAEYGYTPPGNPPSEQNIQFYIMETSVNGFTVPSSNWDIDTFLDDNSICGSTKAYFQIKVD